MDAGTTLLAKLAMQIADVVANEKNININTLIILKDI